MATACVALFKPTDPSDLLRFISTPASSAGPHNGDAVKPKRSRRRPMAYGAASIDNQTDRQ